MNRLKGSLKILIAFICFSEFVWATDLSEKLAKRVSSKGIISLDSSKFDYYIQSKDRSYDVVIMFTALAERFECRICHVVYDEFVAAAYSWKSSSHHNDKLFFAVLDASDSLDVFQKLHLQGVPMIVHYPISSKPKKSDQYLLEVEGLEAENMLNWIGRKLDMKNIPLVRPLPYDKIALGTAVALAVLIVGFVFEKKYRIFTSSYLWGILALGFTFTMLSGYMWLKIHHARYMGQSKSNGWDKYISSSSRSQFVFESYIIGALYAASTLSMVLLIEVVSFKKSNVVVRRSLAVVLCIAFVFVFSVFLSILRMKNGSYPYSLLFQ